MQAFRRLHQVSLCSSPRHFDLFRRTPQKFLLYSTDVHIKELLGFTSPLLVLEEPTDSNVKQSPDSKPPAGLLSSILAETHSKGNLNSKTPTGLFLSRMVDEDPPCKSHDYGRRKLNTIPIPHRSFQEPKGQDLDFVNVAYSHLVHTDWAKLNEMVPGLNPFRVNHVLLRTQKDHLLSYEFFDWVALQKPNAQTLDSYAIIIHILTKAKKFRLAERVLKKTILPKLPNSPSDLFDALICTYRMCDSSRDSFDCLFKTYAHLNKFRCATETFCRMKDYGFLPCIRSANAYMSSLLALNRSDIVLSFYGELRRRRISPNVYTLNMVICALCKSGRIEKAVEVFKDMEILGCRPNDASFNTLIDGYCKNQLLAAAMRLKNSMCEKGVEPNIVTYNTLINGFCKNGMLQDACRLFNEMKVMNVAPNTVTYNTLISGYSQSGNCEMGARLHEEMVKNGTVVDILTYNALLMGLCRDGKTKKALYLLKRLEEENLVPDASTFSAMIIGHCKRGNSERAYGAYRTMLRRGCHPNMETFSTLISAFCEDKDYSGAVKMLMEMIERSLPPDADTMVDLVQGLCRNGECQVAMEVCKKVDERRLTPHGFDMKKVIKITDFNSCIKNDRLNLMSN
ncbi:pentatricopeptide repeat-containing protein At4g26680, mitochondrial [Nymphaea colorata]|uniref:Pentacotripeptide-repeat region of PRORP domain-containing protein n=1 Tax=Nymphaea colorata TaxID=210225 RepID=A0A5K1AF10_9MAGN|nr:pentatricopeptide repeat-containing protein At4g26680, mitochondrial [Nymphaea colorata]